jgi:hypothetical protein
MTVCHYILFLLNKLTYRFSFGFFKLKTELKEHMERCFILCLMQMIYWDTSEFQECHHYIRKVWRSETVNQRRTDIYNSRGGLVEVVNDIITRWLTYIYNSRGGLVEVVNDIITRWLTYIYNSRGGLTTLL